MKKNTFCNNCGKLGHLFHQCKLPITSLGIMPIRQVNQITEILLVRRKDSLAFVDFMRGKYNLEDKGYMIGLFNNMTIDERTKIKNKDFNFLWNYLWGSHVANQYKNEEKISKYKFNELKHGIQILDEFYNVDKIIEQCTKFYLEPEWGFPKGRRNFQERDLACAIREFEEETGYHKNDVKIINNLIPMEEIFTGSNYKSYKHKYFLGIVNRHCEPSNIFQMYEISKMEWMSLDKAANIIREYNVEKKKLIVDLNKLLETYKLYI